LTALATHLVKLELLPLAIKKGNPFQPDGRQKKVPKKPRWSAKGIVKLMDHNLTASQYVGVMISSEYPLS
jgi:hypothetical protein